MHIKLLDFILQFIIILIFYSSLLLLYLLLSTYYFCFQCYLLLQLVSILHFYYFSPTQPFKTNFPVNSHLMFYFLFLKCPHSISTFINLCLLVVNKVLAAFLSFLSTSLLFLYFKSQILPLPSLTSCAYMQSFSLVGSHPALFQEL